MTEPADLKHPFVAHFYRAVVGHMDVWRQRMDATTNWAAATTAAMVTFSFNSPQTPHFVLLLALAFNGMFLLMESRRYQLFDLWRRRFRVLNRNAVAPVLSGDRSFGAPEAEALARVGEDLGRMVPHLSLLQAAGYRIRRNYAYIFGVNLVAWMLKLEVHPVSTGRVDEMVARAAVGVIPGSWTIVLVLALFAGALLLALRAPSEQMINWAEIPSPYERWVGRSRTWGRRGRNRDPVDPG